MELEQTTRITYLIYRRFTETLSEPENDELELWLNENEQNRQFMKNLLQQNFYAQRQTGRKWRNFGIL